MSVGVLAAPGTEYGPCAEPCDHKRCEQSRNEAASSCGICGTEIGFGVGYYTQAPAGLARMTLAEADTAAAGLALVHEVCRRGGPAFTFRVCEVQIDAGRERFTIVLPPLVMQPMTFESTVNPADPAHDAMAGLQREREGKARRKQDVDRVRRAIDRLPLQFDFEGYPRRVAGDPPDDD